MFFAGCAFHNFHDLLLRTKSGSAIRADPMNSLQFKPRNFLVNEVPSTTAMRVQLLAWAINASVAVGSFIYIVVGEYDLECVAWPVIAVDGRVRGCCQGISCTNFEIVIDRPHNGCAG